LPVALIILLPCDFKLIQNNKELYTGPLARNIVEQGSGAEKWRVFVLYKFEESMELKTGTEVLHQVGHYFNSA
jgi:hypothetical protein